MQTPDVISFKDCPNTIAPLDLRHRQGDIPPSVLNQACYCLDLLAVLVRGAEMNDEILSLVLVMLENPTRRCPEALVVGFGSLPVTGDDTTWPRFQRQVPLDSPYGL